MHSIKLIILFLLTPPLYSQDSSKVFITDNPFDYLIAGYNKDPNDGDETLIKIEADFNNDGLSDIAVGDGGAFGNAGTDWVIYLRTKDGKFRLLDEMFFHPSAILIKPIKKGEAKLIAYHRGGVNEGVIAEYKISEKGIAVITKKEVHVNDNKVDEIEYHNLFLTGNVPSVKCILLSELAKNSKSEWKEGYYIRH